MKAKKLPSGNWRAQVFDYTDSAGKKHYRSFTAETKKEAEKRATLYKLSRDSEPLQGDSTITYLEAVNLYIAQREAVLSPSTVREYKKMAIRDFPTLQQKRISRITNSDIQTAINKAAETRAPKTVRNSFGLLTAVFSHFRSDFSVNVELPKRVRPVLHIPNDEEVKRMIDYTREHDPDMLVPILLAACVPLRRSEICALDASDISQGIAHIHRAMVLSEGHKWVIKPPKTYAGDRYVPLPSFILELLPASGPVTRLNPAMISDRFIDLMKHSGAPLRFRFHDLRHYAASVQHAIGVPDAYIMERGGWGHQSSLNNIYKHALSSESVRQNLLINQMYHTLYHTNDCEALIYPLKASQSQVRITGLEPAQEPHQEEKPLKKACEPSDGRTSEKEL